jgi:glycosyltransferase involved in cell wall biosynthesis
LSEGERKRGVVFNVLDPKAIPRCRELLGEEFAAEYVYFTRNLPRSEVPFLFSAAQVLLVPSLAEGFGLPALEAVAVGTMVVTTPVDSLAGVQSENVFLCQGEHLSSIQDALHLALNTQKARDRERFQDKAQSKGVRVRTLRDSIRETYTIYRKVGVA